MSDLDILSWLDDTEPVSSTPPARYARTDTLVSAHTAGMCFEINREVLLSLLSKAIAVVPTRDIIPVLTNFHVTVSAGKLTIVASSTEMSILVETSQVDVKADGEAVIPARTFAAIVKECDSGSNVFVEVTAHGLVVVAKAYSTEVALMANKGFPTMESVDAITFHAVNRKLFVDAITSVRYALPGREHSGQDALRMISVRGGKFTACDGSRFQQVRIPLFKLNMQLPSDKINHLIKFLASSDIEDLEIGESTNKLIFRLGSTLFFMNKLEDPYPNVEQLWLRPALSNDQELLVDRDELITAVKQVKITADGNNAIGLLIEQDSIKVTSKAINDSSSATIACKWQGKPRTIVVNFIHLAEMLRSFPQKECRFLLGEDTKTYKSSILLKDDQTMALATIAQLLAYRAGLA